MSFGKDLPETMAGTGFVGGYFVRFEKFLNRQSKSVQFLKEAFVLFLVLSFSSSTFVSFAACNARVSSLNASMINASSEMKNTKAFFSGVYLKLAQVVTNLFI